MSRLCEICKLADARRLGKRCYDCGGAILVTLDDSDSGSDGERDLEFLGSNYAYEDWFIHNDRSPVNKRTLSWRETPTYIAYNIWLPHSDRKPELLVRATTSHLLLFRLESSSSDPLMIAAFPFPITRCDSKITYKRVSEGQALLRVVVRKLESRIWQMSLRIDDSLQPPSAPIIVHSKAYPYELEDEIEYSQEAPTHIDPLPSPPEEAAAAPSPTQRQTQEEHHDNEARLVTCFDDADVMPPPYEGCEDVALDMCIMVRHAHKYPETRCTICGCEFDRSTGPAVEFRRGVCCGTCRAILLKAFNKTFKKVTKKVVKMSKQRKGGATR